MPPRVNLLRLISLCGLPVLASIALPAQSLQSPATPPPDPKSDDLAAYLVRSVATLEANGIMPTLRDINWTVTLTFQDSADLHTICSSEPGQLQSMGKAFATIADFEGIVSEVKCTGEGYAANAYKLQFRLDYEKAYLSHDLTIPVIVMPVSLPELDENDTESSSQPIPLGEPRSVISISTVTLPDNWKPFLPDPLHLDEPFASYDQTFSFEDGKLSTNRRFVVKQAQVEVPNLEQFSSWRDEVGNGVNRVDIRAGAIPSLPIDAAPPSPGESQAARLSLQTNEAVLAKNYALAKTLIDQAEQADPDYWCIWLDRGQVERAQGHLAEALALYQKQYSLHPDYLTVLGSIASVQSKLGNKDDAISTLQRWVTADPGFWLPASQLMALYHSMHKDNLAASVGDQAMLTITESGKKNPLFLSDYGTALMAIGRVDDAAETLHSLLAVTVDPGYVNDAAYLLAEHNISLAEDEQAERNALDQLSLEGDEQPPDVAALSPQAKTSLITASWDTLGWILFREGKLPEAEQFLRAAWRNRQNPEVGKHLGDLLRAQNHLPQALGQYQLALAAQSHPPTSSEADDLRKSIESAIHELETAQVKSNVANPVDSLAQLNTLPLGPAKKLRDSADYQLLLSAGTITIFPTDQHGIEGGATLLQSTILPKDFFPAGSTAKLARHGKLTCDNTCSFLFLP